MLSAGVLEIGSEPADRAASFFFGALVVEGDEFFQDFFGESARQMQTVGDGRSRRFRQHRNMLECQIAKKGFANTKFGDLLR